MKKLLKILSIIVLLISILLVSLIVLSNIYMIFRILFFGMTVGGEYPDSIWWGKTALYGVDGIGKYYSAIGGAALIVEIPISIVCIIYQIIYFKIIRKNLNNKEEV